MSSNFFRAVDDFAFVQFVGQVGEYHRGQLHPHADVHPVGAGFNAHIPADLFHPLAAAAAHGDDAAFAGAFAGIGDDHIALRRFFNFPHGGVEEEIHLLGKFGIEVFQHHIIDVRAQMAHGSIQQIQLVLDAELFEPGTGGGEEPGALAAVGHVDFVHITHQLQGVLFTDVLVQAAAEVVGDVIFSVGKRARAAEAAHDGTAFAADAGFDFFAVDGAAALFQGMAGFDTRRTRRSGKAG